MVNHADEVDLPRFCRFAIFEIGKGVEVVFFQLLCEDSYEMLIK